MSRGYRGIIVAAFGWLILCGANPPSEHPQSSKSAQESAPTPQPTIAPTPAPAASPTPKFTAYGGYNPDRCYHAEDHDAADLCAQWRAAVAAEKAAHEARRSVTWSIVASLLSFATIVGLIVTIWRTSGALKEARRGNRLNLLFERRSRRESRAYSTDQATALRIASDNAAATRRLVDATIRNQRPYLILINPKIIWRGPCEDADEAYYTIGFDVYNCGKGAAIVESFSYAINGILEDGWSGHNASDWFEFMVVEEGLVKSMPDDGSASRANRKTSDKYLHPHDNVGVIITGAAVYRDVFGIRRQSSVGYLLQGHKGEWQILANRDDWDDREIEPREP